MWDAVLEALIDSVKTLPVLLLVYFLIELMEHKGQVKFEKAIASSKKTGPLWGAGLGCLPQCGFSAVMADLFSRKMITIGTLLAVFIATSDEAFALMLSNPEYIPSLLVLIGIKLFFAIAIGYGIDLFFKNQSLKENNLKHNHHHDHEHTHEHNNTEDIEDCNTCAMEEVGCDTCGHNHLHHHHELNCQHNQKKSKVFLNILCQALWHTLQIFVFILVTNLFLNIVIYLSGGEDGLMALMGTNAWYQPFIAGVIGLIPNCAGSVVLVELYMQGIISFASCLGGLCTSAGIGLIILFKNNKKIKQNLVIMLSLYLIGVVIGLIFNLFLPFKI